MRFLIATTLTVVMPLALVGAPAILLAQDQPMREISVEPFGPPSNSLRFELSGLTDDLLSAKQLSGLRTPSPFHAANEYISRVPNAPGAIVIPLSKSESQNPLRGVATTPPSMARRAAVEPIPFDPVSAPARVQQVAYQEPVEAIQLRSAPAAQQPATGVSAVAENGQPATYGPALPPEMERRIKEQARVSSLDIDSLIADIDRKKESVRSDTNLDEDRRNLSLDALNKAADTAHLAKQWQEDRKSIETRIEQFESDLQVVQNQISHPVEPPALHEKLPTEEFENRLRAARNELNAESSYYNQILDDIKHQAKRVVEIPAETADVRKRLQKLRSELETQKTSSAGNTALMLLTRANEMEAESRIEFLGQEAHWQEMANQLLPLQRDYASLSVKHLKNQIVQWDAALADRRKKELAEQIEQSRREAMDADPTLRSFAQRTTALAQKRIDLATRIERSERERFKLQTLNNDIETQRTTLETAFVEAGKAANGSLLMEVRRTLARPYRSHIQIGELNRELQEIQLAKLRLDEEGKKFEDPREFIKSKLEIDLDDPQHADLAEMAMTHVETQRKQIYALTNEYTKYIAELSSSIQERRNLIATIGLTREFIDKNALWIPSSEPFGWQQVGDARIGAAELLSPKSWHEVKMSMLDRIVSKPIRPVVGIGMLLFVFVLKRRMVDS